MKPKWPLWFWGKSNFLDKTLSVFSFYHQTWRSLHYQSLLKIFQENDQDCRTPPSVLRLCPLSPRFTTQETDPRQPVLLGALSTELSGQQRSNSHQNILWTSDPDHPTIQHPPDIRRSPASQCVRAIRSIQSNFWMMKKISIDELWPTKITRF